jgi:hypothetical protein
VAANVDELAGNEMVSGDFRAHIHQRIIGHAEFDDARLGSTSALAKWPRCGLATFFCLCFAPAPS